MTTLPKATGSRRKLRRPFRSPTLARFILDQLAEAGVEQIFAIPGDFILRLCEVIEDYPAIDLRTMSHEPGVGFAASGAARGREGVAVACVTYGAGALNMVNPVAAAYAEKTPVLVLTGGPGRAEREGGVLVHHQVKSFESQLKVFREVTHYQAVLDDPDTAADRPVLVVGVEVHRFRLAPRVVALAEALGLPVVSTFMGRGSFPDDHPQFAGTYLGPASPPGVTDTGDCLFCSHQIDTQTVVASAYYATMGFGVPAALGYEAATGRRTLVLVGDGGFQMTGWELLHAARFGVAPIVVVMNNRSWEMLQSFLPTGYNELPDGQYAEAARLLGAAGVKAATAAELRAALERARAHGGPFLIEVPLARGDISETLYTFTRSVGTTPT